MPDRVGHSDHSPDPMDVMADICRNCRQPRRNHKFTRGGAVCMSGRRFVPAPPIERYPMGEFHLREGFTYERVSESGDVRLRLRVHHGGDEVVREVTVPENEWASVLASVSAQGENGDTYQTARAFHAGKKTLTLRFEPEA